MDDRKKIMLLGGAEQQIIAIETADRLGYETILCDYLWDNPGKEHAGRFYHISATDQEQVLEISRKEKIDGILAYASDPAAPTAAYVAEKLGLPGNSYRAVETLCRKDLFRSFLSAHGYCTPPAQTYDDPGRALQDIRHGRFKMPVLIKPVDSSGSKGVTSAADPANAATGINYAMSYSRMKRVIVEEWVEKTGFQIAGDGLSIDGKLVFTCFGNDHFDRACQNPFVPVAATFPCLFPEVIQKKVCHEIQRLITDLHMGTCTYNFDIRIDAEQNVYLMEVAPRSGGNYIPDIIRKAAGTDLIECAVRAAMGEKIEIPAPGHPSGFWSYYAVHSPENGILDRIEIEEQYRRCIVEDHVKAVRGDPVYSHTGSDTTIGCYIMKFDSRAEMIDLMEHPDKWIHVRLK